MRDLWRAGSTSRRASWAAIACVGLTLFAACGSDDESSDPVPAAETSSTQATQPDERAEQPEQKKKTKGEGDTQAPSKSINPEDLANDPRLAPYRAKFHEQLAAAEKKQRERERKAAAAPKPPPVTPKPVLEGKCHTSYQPCLDPSAADYDCEGGSGDGPKYTGEVIVLGPDEYELDDDGDGAGCEPT
jgi:hypothetical protein